MMHGMTGHTRFKIVLLVSERRDAVLAIEVINTRAVVTGLLTREPTADHTDSDRTATHRRESRDRRRQTGPDPDPGMNYEA